MSELPKRIDERISKRLTALVDELPVDAVDAGGATVSGVTLTGNEAITAAVPADITVTVGNTVWVIRYGLGWVVWGRKR